MRCLASLLACLVLLSGLGLPSVARAAEALSGPVRVIDADTWDVSGTRVRLHAIDAPEGDQTCREPDGRDWACGRWATETAARFYDGRRATCAARGQDRYGRTVATCRIDGRDVAEVLVGSGIALAYARFGPDYVLAEKSAAVAGLGLHRGSFDRPEDWRAGRSGRIVAAAAPQQPGCRIKGNISAGGARIYHVPGQAFYDRTSISEARGERWFCTAAEARAAGWRPAAR